MFELRAEAQFHAAHKLEDYIGKCANLHGHTWRVVVWVRVEQLQRNGIGIDFGELKQMLSAMLPDHQYLNDVLDYNPTAENMAQDIHAKMSAKLSSRAMVSRVEVWETEKNCAVYWQGQEQNISR